MFRALGWIMAQDLGRLLIAPIRSDTNARLPILFCGPPAGLGATETEV